jgi:hypothetical protein
MRASFVSERRVPCARTGDVSRKRGKLSILLERRTVNGALIRRSEKLPSM